MKKMMNFLAGIGAGTLLLGFLAGETRKKKENKDTGKTQRTNRKYSSQRNRRIEGHQPYGMYEKHFKRIFDFVAGLMALIFLLPVYLILAAAVWVKLGNPVLFVQKRPGKDGKIFELYKFRTMTDQRDENGDLFPDKMRLTAFGKKLRSTSLDELPELFNIIRGDMSFVGPRPLLVEYMPLYDERQARRHEVRPGLTGLAQVHGRNAISWEEKFEWDIKYVEKVSFLGDLKIMWETVAAVLKREGINSEKAETMEKFSGSSLEVKS